MEAALAFATTTERSELYRDLAHAAQEIRLLTDVLDVVTASASIEDVVRILEGGIKSVLPATHWSAIELSLLDEGGQLRDFHVTGTVSSRYWSNVRRGAATAARDLGVELRYVAGSSDDQLRLFDAALADGSHGVAIAPIDAALAEPKFSAAAARRMPAIAFDTPPLPKSAALAYVGTDNYQAGVLAGDVLARLLPKGGLIGASIDSAMTENSIDRMMGLEAGIAGVPIRILPPFEEEHDAHLGFQRSCQVLEDYPMLAGAFGACGSNGPNWGMAALHAGKDESFKIVCFDVTADTIYMLREGTIQATIAQREFSMGYQCIELLARILTDGEERALSTLPDDRVLNTGVDVVTLEPTDWSIALADYLHDTDRQKPDISLRERIRARGKKLALTMIGMADAGDEGVVEQRATLDAASPLAQVFNTGRTLVQRESGEVQTSVLVPLLIHGTVFGAIRLASPQPDACSRHDLSLIERIAGAMAMVIENARLFSQLERRAKEIEEAYQRQEQMLRTISELSSTVIPIAREILIVPLVGTMDTQRAAEFVETMLGAISERHARVVIIDITGVTVVDTSVANHILQAAQAAQLLGAEVIVVGITPAVAQTIVQLGVVMAGVSTYADLENGFAYAIQKVGGQIVYRERQMGGLAQFTRSRN